MLQQDTPLRLKRFEAKVKAEKVASLETTMRDLETMADALSQQIAAEEQRTKIVDARRPEYSMVALNAASRRAKLLTSLTEFRSSLEAAKHEHAAAAAEVHNLELVRDVPS